MDSGMYMVKMGGESLDWKFVECLFCIDFRRM